MAKGNLSPRQKMINLMYLVFIAMLAMQIDQEIIRSYQDTNQSLENTRRLTEYKNNNIFEKTLEAKAKNSPETFGASQQLYSQLKDRVNDLVGFIEGVQSQLKTEAGFDPNKEVEDNFSSLNNTESGTNMFFKGGDAEVSSKTAEDLKAKMTALKDFIAQNFANNEDLKSVAQRASKTMISDFT